MNRHLRIWEPRRAAVATVSATVTLGLALLTGSPASAVQPGRESFSGDLSYDTGPGLCGFPISVTTHYDGFEIDFTNAEHQHVTQQDTFSANGRTLTGSPYTAEVDVRFDSDGNPVSESAQGVVEKLTLPDGSLFIGAGRVDLQADHGDILVVPDVGTSPDLAAFCAALTP